MRIGTMRLADRLIGVPVCFALTAWRKLTELPVRRGEAAQRNPGKILFIKLAEQGATVLAYPAIEEARRMVGRENVYFLVFDDNRPILDAMDVIPERNVITIPTASIPKAVAGAVRAIREVRRLGVDVTVDCEFFARSSAALAYLSGAVTRIGYHAFAGEAHYRGDLLTHRINYNPFLHVSAAYWVMVKAARMDPRHLPALDTDLPEALDLAPSFRPRSDEIAAVRDLLGRLSGGGPAGPVVLLNANCSDLLPVRRWPPERYVRLAGLLLESRPDVTVIFTGAQGEADAVEELAGSIGSNRCFSLAGRTSMRELLTLYTLADVLVTNDSGPAQFASLTPVRVVTLFGPETPVLFAARSPRNFVLSSGLPCSPCVNAYNDRKSPCRDNLCMQRISVRQVFDLVIGLCDHKDEPLTVQEGIVSPDCAKGPHDNP